MASYGRYTGRQAFGVSMAREKFKENVENIRRRQVSARRGLFSQVAFNPVPSLAPNPPELRGTGGVMANALLGAATSIAGGFGGKDVGAPDTGMSVNYDFTPGDVNMDAFTTDFGGVGTFGPFDMNVNAMPDYSFTPGSFDYSSFN